jgi:uncharacterized protein with von Willebrand factor type A (vWA) domain
MSGSMRYGEQYVNVKRMALALDGLIRTEFPGDFLQVIEMFTFAKPRTVAELPTLMPKPVTLYDPVVRLKADMSDPGMSETQIPPHFTNIQHAMHLGRKFLARQDTPNRQMIIITDGLPTQGATAGGPSRVSGRDRQKLFNQALDKLPRGIPVNVILAPMEGDPMAASALWQLAVSTRGSFLAPARDWP